MNNQLYVNCMAVYDGFIKQYTGLPPKIDGAQGKALKSIIVYLKTVAKVKDINDSEVAVVNAFDYVFANWDKLDSFYQSQTKLTQINSNLQILLQQLRNGNSKAKHASINEVERCLEAKRMQLSGKGG